jgi:hypothetical protein
MTTGSPSGGLDGIHLPSRLVFDSSTRKEIFLRVGLAGLGFAVWFGLMNKLGIKGGFAGFVGMFLMVATVALLAMALRSRRRVTLDETGFLLERGSHQILIPWHALADDKALKFEDVMGWQRLNVKVRLGGSKITTSMNRIFTVGLPVREIFDAMEPWIRRAKSSTC